MRAHVHVSVCTGAEPESLKTSRRNRQHGSTQSRLLRRSEDSLDFVSIDVFQGSELLNQSLVLIFQHGQAVFEAFDVFLLLSPTLPGGLPGSNNNSNHEKRRGHNTVGFSPRYNREILLSLSRFQTSHYETYKKDVMNPKKKQANDLVVKIIVKSSCGKMENMQTKKSRGPQQQQWHNIVYSKHKSARSYQWIMTANSLCSKHMLQSR